MAEKVEALVIIIVVDILPFEPLLRLPYLIIHFHAIFAK